MLHRADCLAHLKTIQANSLDSLITDPPAGISFMGKEWDSHKGGRDEWIKWLTEVMTECLRVLKPGAHGLVWAIPRTSHWTATALENAGFEVRDVITHLFGSGFPKSLDISKAIDKAAGAKRTEVLGERHDADKLRYLQNGGYESASGWKVSEYDLNVYAPATEAAKQWQGFGTALKPSNERWLLIRKPLSAVPSDDILEAHQAIGGLLCQMLPAKFVQRVSELSQKESSEVFASAQWHVDVLNTASFLGMSALMDTFKSLEAATTLLNIAWLWSAILGVSFEGESRFTTETESDLITELKILKSWISQITQDTTIRAETLQSGAFIPASTAEKILSESAARLKSIQIRFAPGPVSSEAGSPANSRQQLPPKEPGISEAILSNDIILIRKPCAEKTVAANVLKHGVGGINIDASRIGTELVENGRANRATNAGGIMEAGMKPVGFEPKVGRFPANLILDEEAAALLDEQSGDLHPGGQSPKARDTTTSIFGIGAGDSFEQKIYKDRGGASRFFYVAKASKSERNAGCEGLPVRITGTMDGNVDHEHGNRKIGASPDKPTALAQNHHPTVKPQKLMQYLIKLITPPGGTVLDPFMGSGSTGVAAKTLGFKFLGIEQDAEYFQIAEARYGKASGVEATGDVKATCDPSGPAA